MLLIGVAAVQTVPQRAGDGRRAARTLIAQIQERQRRPGARWPRRSTRSATTSTELAVGGRATERRRDSDQRRSPSSARRRRLSAGHGPGGPRITVDDAPGGPGRNRRVILDTDLQSLVNGLWMAGAEAISINGQRLTSLTAIRIAGEAITVNNVSLTPPYVVSRSATPTRCRHGCSRHPAARLRLRLQASFGFDVRPWTRTSCRCPAARQRARCAVRQSRTRDPASRRRQVIAVLGLLARHPARAVPRARRPAVARAVPADRGGRRPGRRLRRPAGLPRRDLRRQGVRRLVLSATSLIAAADRLPRRPARRRRPAVDRRDRRARHPDLLQRRRHPAAHVPCLSRRATDDEPGAQPGRPATTGPGRGCGRAACARRNRRAARWSSPCCSPCSASRPSPRCALNDVDDTYAGLPRRGPDRPARRAVRHARPARRGRDRRPRGDPRRPAVQTRSAAQAALEEAQQRGRRSGDPRRARCRRPGRASGSRSTTRTAPVTSTPPARRRRGAARRRRRGDRDQRQVRVVARPRSTTADGRHRRRRRRCVEPPYVIDAIGDPHTLATAARSSAAGPRDQVERDGGTVDGRGARRRSTSSRRRTRTRPEFAQPDRPQ